MSASAKKILIVEDALSVGLAYQAWLNKAGFGELVLDAKMGPLTVNAVRAFQRANGLTPDGYPSLDVLELLRAG